MNFLQLLINLGAGAMAGHAAWLSFRSGIPWSFGENFLATVLTCGVFSSLFLGLGRALPTLLLDHRPRRAIETFGSAAAIGLAIPMTAGVLYSLTIDTFHVGALMPYLLRRALWWSLFAVSVAVSRALIIGNPLSGCRAFIGLIPGFLFGGLALDFFFLTRDLNWAGSLWLGLCAGLTLSLALDLLKESWLEEFSPRTLRRQFLLENEDFVIGSDDLCDLPLDTGPDQWLLISEKDGLHTVEALDENVPVIIGTCRFRYHVLHDGDALQLGDRVFIYHTRFARSRDILPEACS